MHSKTTQARAVERGQHACFHEKLFEENFQGADAFSYGGGIPHTESGIGQALEINARGRFPSVI